tara:strand:+ start:14757 stop:15446 length:690 start_codon:yes stop_codon:yes gene_type:complete
MSSSQHDNFRLFMKFQSDNGISIKDNDEIISGKKLLARIKSYLFGSYDYIARSEKLILMSTAHSFLKPKSLDQQTKALKILKLMAERNDTRKEEGRKFRDGPKEYEDYYKNIHKGITPSRVYVELGVHILQSLIQKDYLNSSPRAIEEAINLVCNHCSKSITSHHLFKSKDEIESAAQDVIINLKNRSPTIINSSNLPYIDTSDFRATSKRVQEHKNKEQEHKQSRRRF